VTECWSVNKKLTEAWQVRKEKWKRSVENKTLTKRTSKKFFKIFFLALFFGCVVQAAGDLGGEGKGSILVGDGGWRRR
jgi:hypothetical protein